MGKRFIPVAAVDSDPDCVAVYQRNIPVLNCFQKDISVILDGKLNARISNAEKDFIRIIGSVDFLLAGPPCQGYSDLNNHTRRDDIRNNLYTRVARFAEIAKPSYIVIENVPMAIRGKQKAVEKSLHTISNLGYHLDSGVVDLARIGVPQRRKRHIVVASILKPVNLEMMIKKHSVEKLRTTWWAIGDLEDEPASSMFTTSTNHSENNRRRIKYLHENGFFDLPDSMRPDCHRNKKHTYKSMYGRMRKDTPAQTITGGYSSPGQGRFIHPTRHRTLTAHEAARLQFFPDFYDFSKARTRRSLAEMLGNAAPMKLSYALLFELLQ